MRAVLIEDDGPAANSIALMLRAEAIECDIAGLGEDGIALAASKSYDLILLDLSLPDIGGFEVLKRLRSANVNTPVVVLTGNAQREAMVEALRLGADDYLSKPFHYAELCARMRAVVRRAGTPENVRLTIGKLTLDLGSKMVFANGAKIVLTVKEYEMFETLMLRKGSALSKEVLLDRLYGGIDEPEQKIIDVFVCKLRKKLTAATGEQYIKTVWGRGYEICDPEIKLAG